ncbi:MAG: hypothetical protein GW900_01505 [Gammaproteobacteria bacterium]|nr:hypothetical protein [Gammaproteobacteria bacterium]
MRPFFISGVAALSATLLIVMLLAVCPVWAQEPPPEPEEGSDDGPAEVIALSCRDDQGRPESWLDRSHAYVSRKLCEPAAWFDGFFGDPRAYEETPVGSFFRLRNSMVWDQTNDFSHEIRLSANISLPRISDRVRLLISRDDAADGDPTFDDLGRSADEEDQTRVGLRFLLGSNKGISYDLDGTIKVNSSGLNPRARARARYTRPLTETSLARWTQNLFWEREDGFGTTSRADWEWLPDRATLLRLTARGTVSEGSDGVDWRTGLIGFHQLDQRTAIRSEIGGVGRTDPDFEAEEWFVNFRFRRTFLRDWLFYELQPEHAWPLDEHSGRRRSDWRFIFTVEIQFENSAADDGQVDHYRGR